MTSGIHHVTLITRKVQANIDFYVGFLGLRLVKQTAGYEDAEQLHLFYGDALGSPGTLITFLVWEDGVSGRTGHGQVSEISFAIPQNSIGEWLTRAMSHGVKVEGTVKEFGETVLRLKDPDGVIVKLVAHDMPAQAPLALPIAPTRIRAITLLSEKPDESAAFLARFGYQLQSVEQGVQRLASDSDVIDIRNGRGFVPSIPGAGVFDHVALRAPSVEAVKEMQTKLGSENGITNLHDRKYFVSLYVRDPARILIEYASDGPGFAVDETPEQLGQTLFMPEDGPIPPRDLRVILPQFASPGQPRIAQRDLPFIHRLFTPDDPDGSTILVLHGSGRNEVDMMPFGHHLNPRATLLGARGRSLEEGSPRWFRRQGMLSFDQDDIRAEAEAFAYFLETATRSYGIDPDRLTVVGYSNGANFAAAVMALHPGLIRRAILMRALAALDDLPALDQSGIEVLMLTGETDPYAVKAPALQSWFDLNGADLTARTLPGIGHGIGPEDEALATEWLAARNTASA